MITGRACHQGGRPVWRFAHRWETLARCILRRLAGTPLPLCACVLSCAGCGGKNTTVSTPPPPPAPLATAAFVPGGAQTITVALTTARQRPLAELFNNRAPECTLRAGNVPMVFTAGSSSTWFVVTPQFGNLQPNGTTSIGISSIIWSNVVTGGMNNGFVIVDAQGYNQLTGFTFFIRGNGSDPLGNPVVSIGYTCP